nr:glycosyltransferase family 2 protein [uncultured Flavobacterium sp.]
MTQKRYDAAVILINYNSSTFSKNCIESILSKTNVLLDYQIIIIDNCSETEDYLKIKLFVDQLSNSRIQLIRNNINVGFGAGNMLGVHYSNAEYLSFINNDSLLVNDCLSIIIDAMKKNPDFGICGPINFKENGDFLSTIDHFASPVKEIFGRKILEKINPKKYPNRKKIYTSPQKAQLISGSFMIIKTADFNAVGGFDTNLFLYFEETDLCKRLEKKSKFAYLIPDAKFIHFHGASTPRSILIKKELKISLLYVIRKHYGFFGHKTVMLFLIVKYFFSSILKPKNWPLFLLVLSGAPLSKSLKVSQKISSSIF